MKEKEFKIAKMLCQHMLDMECKECFHKDNVKYCKIHLEEAGHAKEAKKYIKIIKGEKNEQCAQN